MTLVADELRGHLIRRGTDKTRILHHRVRGVENLEAILQCCSGSEGRRGRCSGRQHDRGRLQLLSLTGDVGVGAVAFNVEPSGADVLGGAGGAGVAGVFELHAITVRDESGHTYEGQDFRSIQAAPRALSGFRGRRICPRIITKPIGSTTLKFPAIDQLKRSN